MTNESIVALLIGAIVGVLAGWIISRSRNSAVRAERDASITELKVHAARLESALEQERASESRLSNAFKALSADALRSSNESFLELAKATLEKYQDAAKYDLDQKTKSVEEFVKPLKESLLKVNTQIEEIEKTRRQDYGSLSQHLMGLRAETTSLNAETQNLTNALRTPVVRGRWGEIQLRKVVELAGMLECRGKEILAGEKHDDELGRRFELIPIGLRAQLSDVDANLARVVLHKEARDL